MCADQPAAIAANGHNHYASIVSCRVCSKNWTASTLASNIDALYIRKLGRRKKPKTKKKKARPKKKAAVGAAAEAAAEESSDESSAAEEELNDSVPIKKKAVHVHYGGYTRDQIYQQALQEPDLDAAIEACRAHIGVTRNKSKTLAQTSGFQSASIGFMLHEISQFDVIRDVVPDWMHLILVLVKQFMHGTYDLVAHVIEHAPKGFPKFDFLFLLLMFRKDIPSPYSRARRIPWGMTHEQLKSWIAEECLVWLRVGWPHFFQELLEYVRSWPESLIRTELLLEIDIFKTLWEHMSKLYAPLSNINGMAEEPVDVIELAVNFVDFVANSTLYDKPFFSDGYSSYTLHAVLHVVSYVLWWGNLTEHWCFLYERCAGVYRVY